MNDYQKEEKKKGVRVRVHLFISIAFHSIHQIHLSSWMKYTHSSRFNRNLQI